MLTGIIHHCSIHQVVPPGLIISIHICHPQHCRIGFARSINIAHHNDPVLSDGPGFVREKRINCAKILNGVQSFHNDFPLRHRQRPFCQVTVDNHRQHFRCQSDRHRDGKKECLGPIVLGNTVNDKDHRHQHQHHAN